MDNIKEIEKTLISLVKTDKKNWAQFYILLEQIEKNELWKQEGKNSFTQWVKDFSISNHIHESVIWARKKAGKLYSRFADMQRKRGVPETEIVPIENVNVAMESLVILDKLSKAADDDTTYELVKKTLDNKLSRDDLRESWQAARREKGTNDEAATKPEVQVIKDSVTAAKIISTLQRDTNWLGRTKSQKHFKSAFEQDRYKVYTEFPVYTSTTRNSRRIDTLVAENIGSENIWELNLHGVEIKISKGDLLGDQKYTEYANFCDYIWICVPENLVDIARETKPEICGILVWKDDKISVADKAKKQRNPLQKIDTLTSLALRLL